MDISLNDRTAIEARAATILQLGRQLQDILILLDHHALWRHDCVPARDRDTIIAAIARAIAQIGFQLAALDI